MYYLVNVWNVKSMDVLVWFFGIQLELDFAGYQLRYPARTGDRNR